MRSPEVLIKGLLGSMSFFPSLLTEGNTFDLNAVLLKCSQALGINSDADSNHNNNTNNKL